VSERAVLVKICGVRTLAGAQAAVDAGADLLGFICYPPARRYVPPEQIAAILTGLRGRSAVRAVGVFVNQPVDEMHAVADGCGLDLIQLSGDEGDKVVSLLDRPVIKAWRGGPLSGFGNKGPLSGSAISPPSVGESQRLATGSVPGTSWHDDGPGMLPSSRSRSSPPGVGERPGEGACSQRSPGEGASPSQRSGERAFPPQRPLFAALLEPPEAGWGGAGQAWDWSVARSVTDLPSRPPVFLAGGLRPENVAGAIAAVRPDGVDVSSGVEIDGMQDAARIAAFVAAAKGATTR
jgi:phosphoribosylanthranilate isomerase